MQLLYAVNYRNITCHHDNILVCRHDEKTNLLNLEKINIASYLPNMIF